MYCRIPLCALLNRVQDSTLVLQMPVVSPVFAGVFSA